MAARTPRAASRAGTPSSTTRTTVYDPTARITARRDDHRADDRRRDHRGVRGADVRRQLADVRSERDEHGRPDLGGLQPLQDARGFDAALTPLPERRSQRDRDGQLRKYQRAH